MIPFKCPFCRQTIEVPDSRLGELEKCPTCGNVCQLSRPGTAHSRAGAIHTSLAPDRAARRAKTTRGVMLAFFAAGVICLGIGFAMETANPSSRPTVPMVFLGLSVLLLAIAMGCVPGSIARQRRLSNADGIAVMGILGMVIPIIWLVALILALAGSPRPQRRATTARRPCPSCGESIAAAARKCRFCGLEM